MIRASPGDDENKLSPQAFICPTLCSCSLFLKKRVEFFLDLCYIICLELINPIGWVVKVAKIRLAILKEVKRIVNENSDDA